MMCEVCGKFLGVGEIGICGDCNAYADLAPEDRCDCCGEVRALWDLGFGWFCDDCTNDAEAGEE
jgi:hypothetical protein